MFRVHIKSRVNTRTGKFLVELAIAGLAAVLAVWARDLLVPLTGRSAPFAINFVAVVVATLFAGWRAGVMAALISQAATWFVIIEPTATFRAPSSTEAAAMLLAAAAELFIVAIIARYQQEIDRAWAEKSREHELRNVLLFELKHRVKNTLALVQSIAQQTFRNPADETVTASFQQRLEALAQTHDLLTQAEWSGADIRCVLEQAVYPLVPSRDRLSIEGPFLFLPPQGCLNFALVFHELTTNSLKYGALSNALGRVSVRWTNEPSAGFSLQWRETDGPPLKTPTERGFGTRLIERLVANELGAKVHMRFEESGFSCSFDGPHLNPDPSSRGTLNFVASTLASRPQGSDHAKAGRS